MARPALGKVRGIWSTIGAISLLVSKAGLNVAKVLNRDVAEIADMEAGATEFNWSENQIRNSVKSNQRCYKLEIDQDLDKEGVVCKLIAGYCIVRLVGDEMELLNIVISRDHQGKGYARYLLEFVLNLKDYTRIVDVWLEVRASNNVAQLLYGNLGFYVVGERRGYYTRQGVKEDALIMRRSTSQPIL